jgi:hypothetical protein
VLLDYNEEEDAVQEPTKEKEVKASKWVFFFNYNSTERTTIEN